MSTLRKVLIALVIGLLLCQAVSVGAAPERIKTYGFVVGAWEQIDEQTKVRHMFYGGITDDGIASTNMTDQVWHLEDGQWWGEQRVLRRLTNVTVTVAHDLSTADMRGMMDGTPVQVTLVATGQVEHKVLQHPSPWITGMDGIDGAQVYVETDKLRDAGGTVTIGEAAAAVNGYIDMYMLHFEKNDGQEPKAHQPQPSGPKN